MSKLWQITILILVMTAFLLAFDAINPTSRMNKLEKRIEALEKKSND